MDEQQKLLAPLREKIDAIDQQLLQLLNARANVALEVGEVKKQFKAPVFRPERELQVIQGLQAANPGPLQAQSVAMIWREIMSACRALEKNIRVAYLGPSGTFSEQAAFAHFGHEIEGIPCANFDEVFRVVEAGGAEFGVVPVENSTEGAVSRTLDLFQQTTLKIGGEISRPIHHSLLTQSGTMQGIKSICAHAQALAQCQRWLNANYPNIERHAVSSNAEGARMASVDGTVAAIAGEDAGLQYGLAVVHPHIQDDPHNRTRFVVISPLETGASGKDQTSLILSVKNQAGAVYNLLAPLAKHGVSMTRFESRPARSGRWEYYFYVDIEGHQQDANVAAALQELQAESAYIKVLGSYPRSQ